VKSPPAISDERQILMRKAASVARYVELAEVSLGALNAELLAPMADVVSFAPLTPRIGSKSSFVFEENEQRILVRISVKFSLIGPSKKSSRSPLLVVSCDFHLSYLFRVEGAPTGEIRDELFAAFADINGTYNAWPYVRELVQNTVVRMGLPPFVLPVYKPATFQLSAPVTVGGRTDTGK